MSSLDEIFAARDKQRAQEKPNVISSFDLRKNLEQSARGQHDIKTSSRNLTMNTSVPQVPDFQTTEDDGWLPFDKLPSVHNYEGTGVRNIENTPATIIKAPVSFDEVNKPVNIDYPEKMPSWSAVGAAGLYDKNEETLDNTNENLTTDQPPVVEQPVKASTEKFVPSFRRGVATISKKKQKPVNIQDTSEFPAL
ncbi:hypothetical protein GJ496_008536 [Pomphorhynchus laevis]|nr:hypothetical protein GJ496_008536 [Pomphorhynchus laevis]